MQTFRSVLACLMCIWAGTVAANERIIVDGQAILLNGNANPDDAIGDAEALQSLMRANPTVEKVILSGEFLLTGPTIDAARVIEDFGLATEIDGQCTDACIYLFVAGKTHMLASGAKIGLRRRIVGADFLRDDFEAERERYGWQDEFGQAAMMYDRGQSDMRWALLFLMDHEVTLEFALNIFATPREDMWWPERDELAEGGVIAPH